MMLNKMYHDNMDASRGVKPVSVNGSKVTCRVFFEDEATGGLTYAGNTELPLKCFSDGAPKNASERCGFQLR